ncbi:MAG: AAA domain-containing protein [Hyphomicrobiaceae bacterium]
MLDNAAYDWDASFDDLLRRFKQAGSVESDDFVDAVRALFEDVRDLHETGRVADLERTDLLAVSPDGELTLGKCALSQPSLAGAVATVDAASVESAGIGDTPSLGEEQLIARSDAIPHQPLYYPGYTSWERVLGQHDALTDIFQLGMLAASLATGLDFRDPAELTVFVKHRANIARINPRLHPVLARVVADMTRLRRSERAADLSALIDLIDDYRSIEVDDAEVKAVDFAHVADPVQRRQRTQEYFRNRLFEVTRRNKLLFFADRHGIDLTRGSLPVMLDYRALDPRSLLITGPDLLQRLAALGEPGDTKAELDLRQWLKCADYPFLAPSLEKARSAARKDSRELGFNQLRLVFAFLRWHDDERSEQVNTPLVMLPVSMRRQPGTTDAFSIAPEAPLTEAEVNPVLRYILHDRFRVNLPETLDLTGKDAIHALRDRLEREIGRQRHGLSIRLVDRPRIHQMQASLRRQLDEHRRRQRRATMRLKDWHGVGYSYRADNYQPLGLELFDRFVRTRPAIADRTEPEIEGGPSRAGLLSAVASETYGKEVGDAIGPLAWEIDLCAVTLANFNTRKMSLVRDYETILDGYSGAHANYKRLFETGTPPALRPLHKPPHVERNNVLPSDPSQDDAILRAATGESYVIQGPPGTGKSQTIANLLADLAASGKSVLFVCEKRVALDVVHNRLKDAGIGDLACLVHDAREDRLGFIADLKALYESWLASRPSRTVRDKRAAVAADIEQLSARLASFSAAMQRYVGAGDTTLRDLLGLAIDPARPRTRLSLQEKEVAPSWGDFVAGAPALAEIEKLLEKLPVDRIEALELLSSLRRDFVLTPQASTRIEAILPLLRRSAADLARLSEAALPLGSGQEIRVGALTQQAALATRLGKLADRGKLCLADREAPEAVHLQAELRTLEQLDAELGRLTSANVRWHRKPQHSEAEAWLSLARANEGRFGGSLSPAWRALQKRLAIEHDGPMPSVTTALQSVVREHQAAAALREQARAISDTTGFDDIADLRATLQPFWAIDCILSPAERAIVDAAAMDPASTAASLRCLAAGWQDIEAARDAIRPVFVDIDRMPVAAIAARLATLDAIRHEVVELSRHVQALEQASPALSETWQQVPMPLETLRQASLHRELTRALALAPDVQRVTARELQHVSESLVAKLAELRVLNARRTLDERKTRFRSRIAAGNDDYDVGRAFLEHQFSLYRPSAALRDFLTGAPSVVVRDLKPIWMMSPLSVADTLPLDESLFDVVVFDEASQIPIEDALPSLYRAPQTIVVGDEMQLPPPSYFGRKLDTDDADLPDYIAFGMQAESLLDKAAAALPSTSLEWHYRSRHESLIGFCNQAFYAGRLRTIPSRHPLQPAKPIDTRAAAPLKEQAQRVLSRPISFHHLPDATYVAQRNLREAAYIADLVRALLSQEAGKTIGIVAFSQVQQGAIEDALERLASEHAPFRNRLERAMGLEQEELFVKNLENVQGDERDIIIVSVAYGPGPTGRMIMNFGPINQEGGEKRLNVIFSRAKHHVAVVTSINPVDITNEWNKGAKALKRYLMYAAATSTGDDPAQRAALAGYPGAEHVDRAAAIEDPLAEVVAEAYRRQGRFVVRGLGQSTARCDVALGGPDGLAFTTAVLTDNAAHYAISDVIDRYVTYPSLLRAAGWQVELATARDWLGRARPAEAPLRRATLTAR